MDTRTRHLLERWQSLHDGDGMARAASRARALWSLGLILLLGVLFGVYYGIPMVALLAAAIVLGWVIAERNALRSRMALWPTVARYIDWRRVAEDLESEN